MANSERLQRPASANFDLLPREVCCLLGARVLESVDRAALGLFLPAAQRCGLQ